IVRSEQLSEQSSRDPSRVGGVPGALSNQPPEGGVLAPPGVDAASIQAVAAIAGTPESHSRQTTRNYEIDRTLAYTRQPAGRIKRLTVAVLVDNIRVTGRGGKVTEVPLSEEQLAHITQLV